jgi:protein required for attachment to host cells
MKIIDSAEDGFHISHDPQILFHGRRKQTTWLLTADRQKASIFHIGKNNGIKTYRKKTRSLDGVSEANTDLELVARAEAEIIPFAAGAQKNRGRVHAALGDAPYASDPRDRENHHDDKIFIRDLAEWLDQAAKAQSFDRLIIAAAPRTQGDLRQFLTPHVQNLVLLTLPKDLTTMPPAEIGRYLETEIDFPLA